MDVRHPELRFVPQGSSEALPSRQIAAALAALQVRVATTLHMHSHATSPPGQGNSPLGNTLMLPPTELRSSISCFPTIRNGARYCYQNESGLPLPIFVDPHNARVLGTLTAAEWLPGITRALHGGWPLGKPGSWLLELGDGWAIVMILTGWYLWWPRGRSLRAALWPRWQSGPRLLVRDLHACVAVLFSAVFLFFLVSALPWTAFWGGEILSRIQSATGQETPAGFSIGGASAAQIVSASASIDQIAAAARASGVTGLLSIKLSPWAGAPVFVTNRAYSLADDRIVVGDATSGRVVGDFGHDDLPLVPR